VSVGADNKADANVHVVILNREQRVGCEQGLRWTNRSTFRQSEQLRYGSKLGDVRGRNTKRLFGFREPVSMRNQRQPGVQWVESKTATNAGHRDRCDRFFAHSRTGPKTLHPPCRGQFAFHPGSTCYQQLNCNFFDNPLNPTAIRCKGAERIVTGGGAEEV
jgi:hypothetical protein